MTVCAYARLKCWIYHHEEDEFLEAFRLIGLLGSDGNRITMIHPQETLVQLYTSGGLIDILIYPTHHLR